MKQFEEAIKSLAYELRDRLQQIDEISNLDSNVDISGRIHDGELKIEFSLGSAYSTGGKVEGGSIEAVVKEYLRRFGWEQRNKPLELSFSTTQAETIHANQPPPARVDLNVDIPF